MAGSTRSAGPFDPAVRRALAPARRPLGFVVGAGIWGALLVIAQAFAVSKLILTAIGPGSVAPWCGAVLAIFALRAQIGWLSDVAAAQAAGIVGASVRRRVLAESEGLGAFGVSGESGESVGSLTALATRGATAVEPYLTRYVPALVLAVVLPPLVLIAIGFCDLWSALVVVLTLPLIPIFGILVGVSTRNEAEGQWQAMSDLAGHFLDVMRGLPTLVAFRRARHQSEVIGAVTETYRVRTMRTLRIAFASSVVLELVATLSVAVVAVTIGLRLAQGSVSLSIALPVLLLAPEAYWPLRRVGAEFHAAAEGAAVFSRLPGSPRATSGFTTGEIRVHPRRDPGSPRSTSGFTTGEIRVHHASVPETLHLQDVTVTYPGRTVAALAPVTLDLGGPGVTALVGPSGCGKSTLLSVLAGELVPTAGAISVAGAGTGAGTGVRLGPDWSTQIAFLPQRPVFVAGSVADNLRLAAAEATEADLRAVLERVRLDQRITDLDAEIGESGLGLSAGERARLALARVLLADRPWVFLDEPTAHLDGVTESVIAQIVAELGRRSSVVLVAHRPALVELADRVIPLVTPYADTGRTTQSRPTPTPSVTNPDLASGEPGSRTGQTRNSAVTNPDLGGGEPGSRGGSGAGRSGQTHRKGLGWSWILEGLASASGVALTATAGWLIVRASAHPGVLMLMVAIVGVRTFGIARPVLRYAERLVSHDHALRLLARARVEVYDALIPLVPTGLGRAGRRRGELLGHVVDDVDAVLDRELRVKVPVRGFALMAVIAIAVTALLDLRAAVVIALLTVGVGTLVFLLARRGAARAESAAVAGRAEVSDRVADLVETAAELRRWGALDAALDRIAAAGARTTAALTASTRALAWAKALSLVASGAAVAAVAVLLATGSSTHGGPVAALLILTPLALAEPLGTLAEAGAGAARVAAAQARLDALLGQQPATTDPTDLVPLTDLTVVLDHPAVTRGGRTVLGDVDLTVPPGTTLHVRGPSGSGKSTLAALLLRFLDPTTGQVRLGDVSLRDTTGDEVRRHVGLVDDDPHLFGSSVAENIRFAKPGASDAEVAAALDAAQLGPWLDTLPAGLDTRIGEGGSDVSGGERARLAVARSVLADQAVLVLDEPTAHLDTATADRLVADLLDDTVGQPPRTLIWIGHDVRVPADVTLELEGDRR
ncbi:thiol reductant ABC exporter subunit CydD [Nocardioides sp.]|uniref:thiol reductant ABC exporter subunit CydD n=1 Tax=Nocardioides sp. TaxID=35761 RepID=UPI0026189A67|nr:thiol reductant ABC exporter subunit CydD [Nocardioides sp.]